MEKTRIGEILIANGIINYDQLKTALDYQEKNGGLIGLILIQLKIITKDQLSEYLEIQKKYHNNK